MHKTVIVLFVCGLWLSHGVISTSDFSAWCTATFGGVVDGGRCFYVINKQGDWAQNWAACRANGSVLAQIHTWKERDLVSTYAATISSTARMTALRDDYMSNPACAITTTTYWYDNENTPNLLLSINSTIIKYATCSNSVALVPRCITYNWLQSRVCTISVGMVPICQYTNPVQTFNLTGKCMTEKPIEEFATVDPQDCAYTCSQRVWCRSFNYVCGSSNVGCQLFTRSMDDCNYSKCPESQAENATCHHYNYV